MPRLITGEVMAKGLTEADMVRNVSWSCKADHAEIDRAGAAQPSGFQTTTQVLEGM